MLLQPATVVAAEPEAAPEFVVARLVVAESVVSLRLRRQVKLRLVYFPQRLLVLVPLREMVLDWVPPLDLELMLVGCYSFFRSYAAFTTSLLAVCFDVHFEFCRRLIDLDSM